MAIYETDSAEGSLLGKIIQLNCWWGGAAIYIAVSILPDCCCAHLILDCWIFCSGPLWLTSATRITLRTKDVMISSSTADVLLPWFNLQFIISCARGNMKRVLSSDPSFTPAPIRFLDFIVPYGLVPSGREGISNWVPQNDKSFSWLFAELESRMPRPRVLPYARRMS